MNSLFLGGNSKRHEAWIHDIANQLGTAFDQTVVHDYRHWKTGDDWIDMEFEASEIARKTAEMQSYIVFAKSIGTTLTMKAMYEQSIHPKACLFLGLPLNAVTDMNLPVKEWLESVQVPLYFIHNDNDPYGSADDLQSLLLEANVKATVVVLKGSTHDYLDTAVMNTMIDRLLTDLS